MPAMKSTKQLTGMLITTLLISTAILLIMILIFSNRGLKAIDKAELLLDEHGFMFSRKYSVAFKDIEEIVVTRDKQGELTGIKLIGHDSPLSYLEGWEQMETILEFTQAHLDADTLVSEKKAFLNFLKRPYLSMLIVFLAFLGLLGGIIILTVLLIMGLKTAGFSLSGLSERQISFLKIGCIVLTLLVITITKMINKIRKQKRRQKLHK